MGRKTLDKKKGGGKINHNQGPHQKLLMNLGTP